jgi:general L-amino acid transport system substrate-binding protein
LLLPNLITPQLQCRAIAVAVFGNPDNIELVTIVPKDAFIKLINWEIDVLASMTTNTMERQVFETSAQSGFVFSVPFFYEGLILGGVPDYVECAENLESFIGVCRSLKVCVMEATTHEVLLRDRFQPGYLIPVPSMIEVIEHFLNGTCNVMAAEGSALPITRIREAGYEGPYRQGDMVFSKEPLSLCTRPGAPKWSGTVNMVVGLFYWAEAHNISKANVDDVPSLVDPSIARLVPMIQAIVSEFGNYHDLYQLHLEPVSPRRGTNLLYGKHGLQASRGLLYSYPFGATEIRGEGPIPGLIMDRILARGYLKCGISVVGYAGYPGFPQMNNGTWFGLDATVCRALAAALFVGDADAVEYVEVDLDVAFDFEAIELADGTVDVVAGAPVSLRAGYRGYTFSSPYYYHNVGVANKLEALALMTLGNDNQWSSFVFWVVMAMVYAEENDIGPESIEEMPIVNLFGDGLEQMLRDCVYAVGTYSDVYNNTLRTVARSGANLLNQGPTYGPQQFAAPL